MLIRTIFFFKQKTAYELRISDWSSDVCSSDLPVQYDRQIVIFEAAQRAKGKIGDHAEIAVRQFADIGERAPAGARIDAPADDALAHAVELDRQRPVEHAGRVDIVATEILQEYRGVDTNDVERQPPRLVGIEIERRRMEQQLAAAEGPASALDANAVVAEQIGRAHV